VSLKKNEINPNKAKKKNITITNDIEYINILVIVKDFPKLLISEVINK
tara:strand:- start:24 stop:167 length:144 start_codon:yes stop_codon:yes gene_type:complete